MTDPNSVWTVAVYVRVRHVGDVYSADSVLPTEAAITAAVRPDFGVQQRHLTRRILRLRVGSRRKYDWLCVCYLNADIEFISSPLTLGQESDSATGLVMWGGKFSRTENFP
jgi:hypothetical protein